MTGDIDLFFCGFLFWTAGEYSTKNSSFCEEIFRGQSPLVNWFIWSQAAYKSSLAYQKQNVSVKNLSYSATQLREGKTDEISRISARILSGCGYSELGLAGTLVSS